MNFTTTSNKLQVMQTLINFWIVEILSQKEDMRLVHLRDLIISASLRRGKDWRVVEDGQWNFFFVALSKAYQSWAEAFI